jgi:outer membrane protein assembly factor BamB
MIFSFSGISRADNWPQWRGPAYDGVSKEASFPTTWGDNTNVAWRLKMPGAAGSTPAVWGDRIFLTSEEGKTVVLLCVSTEGKELWKQKLGAGGGVYMRGEGNDASASPSTDGKFVYTFTGKGDLACFDFDGKEVWKFNAQQRYGKFEMQWGTHTTPLLYGDRLYLQLIHSGGAHVIAIDKSTGKDVWNVKRKSDAEAECEQSYASVVPWTNGSASYIITHGADYAVAHRIEDGAEIWRLGNLNPQTDNDRYNPTLRFVASPAAVADLIVVPTAKNGPVVGVKPDAHGLVSLGSKQELWRRRQNTPDVPSPLVHDGLVYLCRENGVLLCLEAANGKELYSEALHRQRYRASPVLGGGHVYLTARDGVITVVKAGRQFEKVAENRLKDQITASPVLSNGRIYLRGFDYLYAIGTSAGVKTP